VSDHSDAAKIDLANVGGSSGEELYELRWELRQRITAKKLISASSSDALLPAF
jgi:hypothetical protein